MKRLERVCLLVLLLALARPAEAQWSYVREIKAPSTDTAFVRPFLCTVDGSGRLYMISSKATDATAHNAIYYADPGDSEFKLFIDYQKNGDSDTLSGNIWALRGIGSVGNDIVINASQPFPKTMPNTVASAYYYPNRDTLQVQKYGSGISGAGYGTYNHGFTLTKDTLVVAAVTHTGLTQGPSLRFYNFSDRVTTPSKGSFFPWRAAGYRLEPGGPHNGGVDVIRDCAVLPAGDYSLSATPIYTSRNSLNTAVQSGGIAVWTGGTIAPDTNNPDAYVGQRVADAVGLLSFTNYVAVGITVDASGQLWVARGDTTARWVKAFDMSSGIFASEVAELPGQNSMVAPVPSGAPMAAPCDVGLSPDGMTAYVIDNVTRSAFVFTSQPVAVEERPVGPSSFVLRQNYPNPFNPATTMSFDLSTTAHVRLAVTNQLGQEVGVLVDGMLTPGTYVRTFNAARLPSGAYYYTLKAGALRTTRSMILMK